MRKLQSFTVPQPNPVCVRCAKMFCIFGRKAKKRGLANNTLFYSQKESLPFVQKAS
jgi:hypothetical protein